MCPMNALNYTEGVKFALAQKGIIAENFEDAGLRVYERYDFNPKAVYSAVGKGGIVMPIVRGTLFTSGCSDLVFTVIVKVDRVKQLITLFNPFTKECADCALVTFIEQWVADGGDCITAFQVDNDTYIPHPHDLSQIQLPEDLKALCEEMAENAHDVWANERQSEGWTYGLKRDDHKLQTPDMIPYSQLPDTEKQYDRLMATGTLKLLIALGYKIEKFSPKL